MSKLIHLIRPFPSRTKSHFLKTVSCRLYSEGNNESKNGPDVENTAEKKEPEKNAEKKESALDKLNLLLKKMVESDKTPPVKLDLAKPIGRKMKSNIKPEPGQESATVEKVENNIVSAVKNVAQSLGGDKKQTESELLTKLLNPLADKQDNIVDIIKGMIIDRDTKVPEASSRAQVVRRILNTTNVAQQQTKQLRPMKAYTKPKISDDKVCEPIDILDVQPLGIFTPDIMTPNSESVECKTWDRLQQRELKLAVTHPPSNYFQQMILWTEEEKIWKFPIDNEQGLDEEKKLSFVDHIFLDKHLESWCPTRGPIRHFMELVTVGLSKNSYLTVEEKKDHIEWYRNYFEEKKSLLKELEAIPADSAPKQIES